jgi:hypothetical protein
MIKKLIISLLLIVAATMAPGLAAQSVYSFEVGGVRDISTYLSPLYYHGTDYAISGSWQIGAGDFTRKAKKLPMRFEADIHFQDMLNPAKTASMLGAVAHIGYGIAPIWQVGPHWRLSAGGAVDLYGGALWLTRNGNNPVTALASVGLDITGSAAYRFRIKRLPITVEDRISIPTLSAFFCPEYGESFYEISLGNRSGLAHFGWWGNAIGVNNLLSATLHLGRCSLLVGYRLGLRTFNANHLTTQLLNNSFLIGIAL